MRSSFPLEVELWEPSLALLRGINVGGRVLITMAELRALFVAAGLEEVRTYIQSGNVLFRADRAEEDLVADLEGRLSERMGRPVGVLIRGRSELESVAADHPLWVEGEKINRFHVIFLDRAPDPLRVAALDPARSPPDRFRVVDRALYLDLPNGAARTKLSLDWFERQLGVRGTGRNWRSVTTLAAMAANS